MPLRSWVGSEPVETLSVSDNTHVINAIKNCPIGQGTGTARFFYVPDGSMVYLHNIHARVTTSAAIGNRLMSLTWGRKENGRTYQVFTTWATCPPSSILNADFNPATSDYDNPTVDAAVGSSQHRYFPLGPFVVGDVIQCYLQNEDVGNDGLDAKIYYEVSTNIR
jgi:hypothetical protein